MSDYEHRFHVGNVGDVLKHVALVALLEALEGPLGYLETHAGAGRYKLAATGEWLAGVGRLEEATVGEGAVVPAAVARYLEVVRTVGIWKERSKVYPGSPNLAQALCGPDARLELYELADEACASLRDKLGGDARVAIHQTDGFAALVERLSAVATERRAVALIDPPYGDRNEWRTAADVLAQAHHACPQATLALWYPVISLSRPNTLFDTLRERGVPATVVELVTSPLEHNRRALNGSGLVLVAPPDALLPALLESLPFIGRACATEAGRWSIRALAW